jgi:hypothetical protein
MADPFSMAEKQSLLTSAGRTLILKLVLCLVTNPPRYSSNAFPRIFQYLLRISKCFQEGDDSDVVISFEFETLKFPAKIGIKSRYQVFI